MGTLEQQQSSMPSTRTCQLSLDFSTMKTAYSLNYKNTHTPSGKVIDLHSRCKSEIRLIFRFMYNTSDLDSAFLLESLLSSLIAV